MTFSEKLQTLRKAAGLSQEQLAEQLGVTRQAVSKWETGEGKPDIDNLLPLAKLLHTTVDYLLDCLTIGTLEQRIAMVDFLLVSIIPEIQERLRKEDNAHERADQFGS